MQEIWDSQRVSTALLVRAATVCTVLGATVPYPDTPKQVPFVKSRNPEIRSCFAVKMRGWSRPTGS